MGVDFLAKYVGDPKETTLGPGTSGPCFRVGNKLSKYVYFRHGDGTHAAFGYFLLQSLVYDPDPEVGLVLRFGTAIVTIQGVNLHLASQPLMDHLVQECCVGDERQGKPAGLPFVTRIEVEFK